MWSHLPVWVMTFASLCGWITLIDAEPTGETR